MSISSPPHGYSAARLVRDYTHQIELSGGERLVFNLLTGLAWQGPANEAVDAGTAVERDEGGAEASHALENLEAEFQDSPHPLSFQLIPTYGCNFSCAYCYEGSLTSKQKQWTPLEIAQVVSACTHLAAESGRELEKASFTVLGGEVIRSETFKGVETLVSALYDAGARRFEAITNGFELAEHAAAMKAMGIGRVQITVDGPRAIHDKRRPVRLVRESSFERILDGIEACLGLGVLVNLRVNIDQRNIPHLPDLFEVFDSRGWLDDPLFRGYLAPLERDYAGKMYFAPEDEMARMLVAQAEKNPLLLRFRWDIHGLDFLYAIRSGHRPRLKMRYCGATRSDYMLDARNGVYACWFGAGQDQFKLADISEVATHGKLPEKGRRKLNEWRSRGPTVMPHCSSCKWSLICGGGCAYKAAVKTGGLSSPNCAPFAGIFEAAGKTIYEHQR